jgi:hypothetical protein
MRRAEWIPPYVLLPCAAAVSMFAWIVGLDFFLDDFTHLYHLRNGGYLRLVFTPHGGHLLLTSSSAYYLLYTWFGLTARYWFAVVLLTHALNAVLLFRLVHALTGRAVLAALLATLWAASPINQGVLGWFATYGHALVATFTLGLLGDIARHAGAPVSRRRLFLWALLLAAAATSFGFGFGMAFTFPVAALLLFPATTRRPAAFTFTACACLLAVAYPLQRWLCIRRWGSEAIPFDVAGILSTAGRTPGELLPLAVSTFIGLIGYAALSVAIGPFALQIPPGQLFRLGAVHHVAIAFALAATLCATVVVLGAASRQRKLVIALALLVAGGYAPVAVVNASRVVVARPSGVIFPPNVEMARYHYAGPALITALLSIVLAALIDRWPKVNTPLWVAFTVWLVATAPVYWRGRDVLISKILRSTSSIAKVGAVMKDVRAAVQRYPVGADAYVENRSSPFPMLQRIHFPGTAGVFILAQDDDVVDGRHVRFIERDKELLPRLRAQGGRLANLLVPPHEVPMEVGGPGAQ